MAQLKMYRLMDEPFEEPQLPEGYSYGSFDPEKDIHAWCECLRGGNLIEGRTDEEAYRDEIVNFKDIDPARDIQFIDYHGEHIGTATCFTWSHNGHGDMHQVGIRADFRGKGLAKYLSYIVLKKTKERGVKILELTTGEGRPAAVRSYLAAGFHPVEYDYRMQERWEAFMRDWKIGSLDMLYEDGTPYKTIYAHKTDRKIRVGVFGAGRGRTMMNYCRKAGNADLVAICDKDAQKMKDSSKEHGGSVALYTDFDEFIKHDMDLVVLANFANEHAPYAIKAMKAGKHVLSEVLPVQSMKEAVELVETVEQTGMKYMYAENYCFMGAPKKMRKLFKEGRFGDFEYGEGEYMHNCEPSWAGLTYADPDHWRNTMSAFYYCTHSLGPLIHISGMRPVSVTGFEAPFNEKMMRMGAKAGPFAIEMVTLENGAILKSLHGVGPSKNSIWYSVYGSRGVMESGREAADCGGVDKLYMNADEVIGSNDGKFKDTRIDDGLTEFACESGHGGSDYYVMYNAVQHIRGNQNADVVDVYEALDMFLPGYFALLSAIEGGKPMTIPDLRDPAQRDKWRNDDACTDPKTAKGTLLPSYSKGTPEIPSSVYDRLRDMLDRQ